MYFSGKSLFVLYRFKYREGTQKKQTHAERKRETFDGRHETLEMAFTESVEMAVAREGS